MTTVPSAFSAKLCEVLIDALPEIATAFVRSAGTFVTAGTFPPQATTVPSAVKPMVTSAPTFPTVFQQRLIGFKNAVKAVG
jgi:hypothetical protein